MDNYLASLKTNHIHSTLTKTQISNIQKQVLEVSKLKKFFINFTHPHQLININLKYILIISKQQHTSYKQNIPMVLHKFDFFRKIQSQQQLSSATGGFFTIGSLIVAGILVFLSIKDFTSAHYITSLKVRNDPTQYIPMKIDITFNKAPCQLVKLQFHDELQFVQTGLQTQLDRFNTFNNGSEGFYIATDDREQLKQRAQSGLNQDRGCRLKGVIRLAKTPGTLTFDTVGKDNLILQINPANRFKIRSSYLLKQLQFGQALKPFQLPVTHSSQSVEQYIKKLEGDIATRKVVQDFQNRGQRLNFYNHLKIIPVYVDDGTYKEQKDRQKYRYSLRSGSANAYGAGPTLQIYTQIQPINIVYRKNDMTFYDLCVDILAIAGGSVATIGVINSVYHFLFAK